MAGKQPELLRFQTQFFAGDLRQCGGNALAEFDLAAVGGDLPGTIDPDPLR